MGSLAVLVFPRASPALVRAHAPHAARLIAVDAGAEACLDADITPWAVVGDMDSVRADALAECEKRGARIERHPADKRDTDAALALQHARGFDEVFFLGAGGGRADHALANLHLLAHASTWARAHAIDEGVETWVVTPDRPLELHLAPGTVVSAIPFDARVEGVTYEGLAYGLADASFRAGDPYGMSNVAVEPRQRVSVRAGRLLVLRPVVA